KDPGAEVLEARAFWHCTGFPCDPSMFYRFVTSDATIERFVSDHRLRRFEANDSAQECYLLMNAPRPAPEWWPFTAGSVDHCFTASEPPNVSLLVYDPATRVAYLLVQNT